MEKSHQVIIDEDLWNELKVISVKEKKTMREKLAEIIRAEVNKKNQQSQN